MAKKTHKSPYTVKKRKDGVWCIYIRDTNVIIAEFAKGCLPDIEVIGMILDGKLKFI